MPWKDSPEQMDSDRAAIRATIDAFSKRRGAESKEKVRGGGTADPQPDQTEKIDR